ncbi:MAG: protein-methionine-sulfoxide reductase heme-binding subunit MsrQ [Tateyamaria sp.]|uniref:protein-methionine-sulfoxide reductase heme-binding subunit MsrQ n=1 Tax=Tateyamaria sp. TaxID=1929288 RepID=UPI00328DAE12
MTLVDRLNAWCRKVPTWAVYIVCLIPIPVLYYQAVTGGLGRDPVKGLEHELGEIALQLLILGLSVSPLRKFTGLNLLKFRRAIGVVTFVYVSLHLLVYAALDVQSLGRVWADIVKRPYITVGMLAFVLMIPLVATSNNRATKALGATWRKLHLLTYPIAILGAAHFIWLSKGFQLEPLVYLAIVLLLLSTRLPKMMRSLKA